MSDHGHGIGRFTMRMEAQQRVMGPVDYAVFRFPGNKFTGQIAPELSRLEQAGIVRIIDILFISKDDQGNVRSYEIDDLGEAAVRDYRDFVGRVGGWLSQDDVEFIGDEVPNNSSVGAILYENTWAVRLKTALMDAGAEIISQGRIPPHLIDEVMRSTGRM